MISYVQLSIYCQVISLILCFYLPGTVPDEFSACLPEGVTLKDVVLEETKSDTGEEAKPKPSVRDSLLKLKAHCEDGKLLDGKGREIRFHHFIGCWGNPPEDYQEILQKQRLELESLRKKYTVVELSCASAPDHTAPN